MRSFFSKIDNIGWCFILIVIANVLWAIPAFLLMYATMHFLVAATFCVVFVGLFSSVAYGALTVITDPNKWVAFSAALAFPLSIEFLIESLEIGLLKNNFVNSPTPETLMSLLASFLVYMLYAVGGAFLVQAAFQYTYKALKSCILYTIKHSSSANPWQIFR